MSELPAFTVDVAHPSERETVVSVAGDLDMRTGSELRRLLLGALTSAVVVLDLSACDFCDSSGLRTIFEAWHAAKAAGVSFRVAGVARGGARRFGITGFEQLVSQFPTVSAALLG
ncbi:MAG TPA: STAS domain-containing protein [Actinospica sp.]|nr:STAS domain-containing protein [Actinospica sp.]